MFSLMAHNTVRKIELRELYIYIQSFSALKKITCARAQRSDGNFERHSRSIFRQSCALARAQ